MTLANYFMNFITTFLTIVAVLLVVYVGMVVGVLRQLEAWGRRMEKSAAMHEREQQEYMIGRAMASRQRKEDRRRQQEEHARRMKALDARQR